MADPVGVVSLGIEVCKALVKYYTSWKDAPRDVSNMCESLHRITGMFEAIHHKIERAQFHGRDADQVGRCISQCSSAITDLKLKLHKFEERGPQDKFGRLKEIGYRLQYPFEKTTLLEIKANISDIRADLTEAMAILQMDISVRSYQKTEEVWQQVTQTLKPSIDGIQAAEKNRAAQEERNTILMWLNTLSPLTFTDTYNSSLDRKAEGTGAWIFEDEDMKQWLDGTLPVLWCPGGPGSGKSVAMSIVVKHLLDRTHAKENIAVAYTYCVYNQEHQTAANFLASLLAQFALQSAEMSTDLRECCKTYHRKLAKPSSPEYVRLLRAVRGQFRKSYILVDALDEVPETERQSLVRDLKTFTPDIQILVTSRNDCSHGPNEDEEFLSSAVEVNHTLRDGIINAINQKTEGMFLIAELHITALSQEDNVRDVREKLENLPSEIADTYMQTMARIDNQKPKQAERARQVLCWLTHACRPLQVRELQQALAVRPTDKEFVHGGETSIDALLSYCMGLVIVDKQTSEHPSDNGTGKMEYASVDIVRQLWHLHGLRTSDIDTVLMTHLHHDHAGGLHHFPRTPIWVSRENYHASRGLKGTLTGSLPKQWPVWFKPKLVDLSGPALGPFEKSLPVTDDGAIALVSTPGHVEGHLSVIARDTETDVTYFIAGDASYNEKNVANQETDGVTMNPKLSLDTLRRIKAFAQERRTILLCSHDSGNSERLEKQMFFPTQSLR
ncbi:ankyrin [Aureobasidium pullulans]|nr:ankyrin [Aureobasidium pullulans]